MPEMTVDLTDVEPRYVAQLEYAVAFAGDEVLSHSIDVDGRVLRIELAEGADRDAVRRKIEELVARYRKSEFGFRSTTYFEQDHGPTAFDAWEELVDRRWVTEVGDGHVILRGIAARLLETIDGVAVRDFARPFDAELERYPATIRCETLDRVNHFTSFPEHIDFVAPLRSDLDVLEGFADACREDGWTSELHRTRMADHSYAISPSCCYHCYEGMEGWELEPPGRCVTAVLGCHRFEGANQRDLSRLRAFSMREVVWVGHPKWVLESRAKADEKIVEWARRWGLTCSYETANDMFFSKDYAVKASFQRQQEAKKELRARVPQDDTSISIFSSNFHASSFGSAFGIKVGGRPAVSACVAWGLERFMYAVFSQHGLDVEGWPAELRRDFAELSGGGS